MNYKNNELEKTMKEIEYSNAKVERQNTQLQQSIDSVSFSYLALELNDIDR